MHQAGLGNSTTAPVERPPRTPELALVVALICAIDRAESAKAKGKRRTVSRMFDHLGSVVAERKVVGIRGADRFPPDPATVAVCRAALAELTHLASFLEVPGVE